MGSVSNEIEHHKTFIQRWRTEIDRDQATVKRFIPTAKRYAFPKSTPAAAWVKRLPEVEILLNNEVPQLTGKKPAAAIKEKTLVSRPSTRFTRPVGFNEEKLPSGVNVWYLYRPRGPFLETPENFAGPESHS